MKRLDIYAKEKDGSLVFDNKTELIEFLLLNRNKSFQVTIKRETGVRTAPQNNGLHKWFEQKADQCRLAGVSPRMAFAETMELEMTPEIMKEIWRYTQTAMYGKRSTTKLDKVEEIDEIVEHLNRFFADNWNLLGLPFPSKLLINK